MLIRMKEAATKKSCHVQKKREDEAQAE